MTAVFRIMFKLVRFLISPNDRQHVTSLVCLKNVTTLIHYLTWEIENNLWEEGVLQTRK
jgi:hypothetical protein